MALIGLSSLDTKHVQYGLTLTELEATTCLRLTRLLALDLAAVACQESLGLQCFLVLGVQLDQCACNGETQSLALTRETATVEVHFDVVLLGYLKQVQRLLHHILQDSRGEIFG